MKINLKILLLSVAIGVGSVYNVTLLAASADKKEQSAKKGPEVAFVEKQYNFGYIPEDGGPVSHFFEFKNTGDSPLVIISATASCGCTRPTYPTEPIAPGKTGKIKVTYLPEGRPGEFDKIIKVRTNAKDSKKITLKIKGSVTPK